MKKPFSFVLLMLSSLSTSLFYQNCAEIEQSRLSSGSQIVEYLPLFTDELKLIDETYSLKISNNRCRKTYEVLFSPQHNLCIEVKDSCAFSKLAEHGFKPVDQNLGRKLKIQEPIALASNSKVQSKTMGLDRQLSSLSQVEDPETEVTDLKNLIHNCQISVVLNDLKPVDFKVVDLKNSGYIEDPDLNCAQRIESLVNFKSRTCSTARDSCHASHLKRSGYVNDYFSFCPQI